MKCREVASIVVFVFMAWSFFMINHNNQLENERIGQECQESAVAK